MNEDIEGPSKNVNMSCKWYRKGSHEATLPTKNLELPSENEVCK